MTKQYVLLCENKNDYFEVTSWIKETGIKDKNIEFICNPKPDIHSFEGVIAVFDNHFHNNWQGVNNWAGHSHIMCVTGQNTEDKKKDFYKVFCHMLGIPAPVEIERKYLIEIPDIEYLNSLPNCKGVNISQMYLDIPGKNVRIRNRDGIYIKTEKSKISDITRQEIECTISENEYNELSEYRNEQLEIVSKVRYCLLYDGKYFEIDIFPFWEDIAYLELELTSEDEKVDIPPFIKVIKEVTMDKRYTNKSIASYLHQGNINEIVK